MSRRSLGALVLALSLVAAAGCSTIRERVWMNEGNKLYKAQKYEEAIEQYKKIVAAEPENWIANYQIAMSYLAAYHPGSTHPKDVELADKSIAGFEKLMTLKAPDPATKDKVQTYYIAVLRAAERTDKVIAFYDKLLQQDPKNTAYIAQLAEIYAKKGDIDNALKYYEKRTEIEPDNKEGWYTVGVVCWEVANKMGKTMDMDKRMGYIDRGTKAFEKALAIDPNYFESLVYINLIYREKSVALSEQGKAEEAGEAYSKADEFRNKAMEIGKKRMAEQAAAKKGA